MDYFYSNSDDFTAQTGRVTIPQPVAGAKVILTGEQHGMVYEAVTDDNGYYRVTFAVPDVYTPSITSEQYIA